MRQKKQVTVSTKINLADRDLLKKQADRMGLKFSAYIAWLILNSIPRTQGQELPHV